MATTQLERIATLVQRLDPLRGKQRGMRIEAEEWNALVDVLRGILEVDRAQEDGVHVTLEERFAKKSHEHLGEVSLPWLDAELQAGQGGGGGSLSTRSALVDMRQQVQALSAEVARLTTLIETQQKFLDRSAVDEIDRGKSLRAFEGRFAGVENLRTLVTNLSGQQESLGRNVNTVLELRRTLSDAQGNPIDVSALRQDLARLQALRDNLTGVDGSLLRVRDLELKLTELSDAVGVGGPGGLERRLGDLSATVEGRLNNRIDERTATLQTALTEAATGVETRLRTQLSNTLAENTIELDRAALDRLGVAEGRLRAEFTAQVTVATDAIRQDSVTAARAFVEQRFAEAPNLVATAVNTARAEIMEGLRGELNGQVTTQVRDQVAAVEARLSGRLSITENQVGAFRQELPTLVSTRVAEASDALADRLNTDLDARMAQVRQGLESRVNAQVSATVTEALGSLDARIAGRVDQGLSGLDTKIAQAVAGATRDLSTQIDTEVRDQVTALNLSQQIDASTASARQQLRGELAVAIANQQAQATNAVNDIASLLRAETDAKVRAGAEEAIQHTNSQLGRLRDDVNRTIDERLQRTRDGLVRDFDVKLNSEIGRVSDTFGREIRRLDDRTNPVIIRPPSRRR
jgi:hypothetical protein